MKAFDFSAVRTYRTYRVMMPLLYVLGRMLFFIRHVGKENVPKTGPLIIASNHTSAPDPAFVCTSRVREIHYMGKIEFFENPVIGPVFTKFNAFPVKRGSADKQSIEYAVRLLGEGRVLGMFPEGTRSRDGIPHQAKAGVALIAKAAKADVLPVSIYSKKPGRPFHRVTVRFGKVIPYESLGMEDDGPAAQVREAARIIMDENTKLWEEDRCRQ